MFDKMMEEFYEDLGKDYQGEKLEYIKSLIEKQLESVPFANGIYRNNDDYGNLVIEIRQPQKIIFGIELCKSEEGE